MLQKSFNRLSRWWPLPVSVLVLLLLALAAAMNSSQSKTEAPTILSASDEPLAPVARSESLDESSLKEGEALDAFGHLQSVRSNGNFILREVDGGRIAFDFSKTSEVLVSLKDFQAGNFCDGVFYSGELSPDMSFQALYPNGNLLPLNGDVEDGMLVLPNDLPFGTMIVIDEYVLVLSDYQEMYCGN